MNNVKAYSQKIFFCYFKSTSQQDLKKMASDAKVLENVVLNKDSELKAKNDTIQRMVFIYFLDFLQFEYLSYFLILE